MKSIFVFTTISISSLLIAACLQIAASAQPSRDIPPVIALNTGHTFAVEALAFSPDGETLASAGWPETIKIWTADTLELIRILESPSTRHSGAISSLAFSPDGKFLIAASEYGVTTLWNTETGELIHTFGKRSGFKAAAFNPGGKTYATGNRHGEITLWDMGTDKMLCQGLVNGKDKEISSIAFSPDGKSLSSSGEDGTVRFWNPDSCALIYTLTGHKESISSIAFSHDGKKLVTADYDGEMIIWNMGNRQPFRRINADPNVVWSVAFTASGKNIVSLGGSGAILRWNAETGENVGEITTSWYSFAIAINPRRETIAVGTFDGVIELFDTETKDFFNTTEVYNTAVRSLAFSPDGLNLASASYNNQIFIWNLKTGRIDHTLQWHSDTVMALAYTRDGKRLVSAGAENTIAIWNPETGDLIRTLEEDDIYIAGDFALNHDGRTLAARVDHNTTIGLFDIDSGRLLQKLPLLDEEEQTEVALSFVFIPNGEYLALGMNYSTVEIYNLQTKDFECALEGEEAEGYRPYDTLVISPNGAVMAAATMTDSTWPIDLWDMNTGNLIRTFETQCDDTQSISFTPDGKDLFYTCDRKIVFRDIATGGITREFEDSVENNFFPIAFHPGGKLLASGSGNTGIKFWNLESGDAFAELTFFPDGNWLITDANGRFDCSGCATVDPDGALEYIRWRIGTTLYSAYEYFNEYYKPDLLGDVMKKIESIDGK
jgi:WD40 repeat protein